MAPTFCIWTSTELALPNGLSLDTVDSNSDRKTVFSHRDCAIGGLHVPRIHRCRRHRDRRAGARSSVSQPRVVGTPGISRKRDLAARYHDFEPKLIGGLVVVAIAAALYLGGSLAPDPWRDRLMHQLGAAPSQPMSDLQPSNHLTQSNLPDGGR